MNYSGIQLEDIANGPGIRTSLFVSGCQFHWQNCFNQEAQDYNYGKLYTQETEDLILSSMSNYTTGLSILGGDPLWQNIDGMVKLISLCKKVHELNKNIWLWSGFTWEYIFPTKARSLSNATLLVRQSLVKNVNVLVDGEFVESKKDLTLKFKGSSNQRIIQVQPSLNQNKIVLYEE